MASTPATGQCIRRPGLGLLLVTGAGMALTRSGSDGLKLGEEWAARQTRSGRPLRPHHGGEGALRSQSLIYLVPRETLTFG